MENANIKLKNGSSSSLTKFSSDEESIDYRKKNRSNKQSGQDRNSSFGNSEITLSKGHAKKSGKNNIFISPVFVSDSVDSDVNLSGLTKKSTARPIFQQQGSNDTNKTNDFSYENNDVYNTSSIYTKRLLQLRKNNIQNMNHTRQVQQEEYKAARGKKENGYYTTFKRNIRKMIEKLVTAKQTVVPMFLIAILVVFFVIIIIMYMNMSPNIEKSLQQSIFYLPCDNSVASSAEFGCIEESKIETLLKMLKVIGFELQKRSEKFEVCNQKSKEKAIWCVNKNLHEVYPHLTANDMIDVQYLIDKNAFLGINNVDSFGNLIAFEKNMFSHKTEHCFSFSSQGVPLYCSFYAKIHKYFAIIGTLTTILIIILATRKVYSYLLLARENRERQINQIVEDILSYVLESTMDDEDDETGKYIIVNEMKDKLLMLSKNIELSWAWNEALKYLEKHDRRIHFGFENVKGEDVKIIRMIPIIRNNDAEKKGTSNQQQFQQKNKQLTESTKKWNGCAFDKSNKIKDPPTSCLKIRQMFDKFEVNNPNLLAIIRDTIFLKVSDKGCKIHDIQLDKKTCCVYVKCKSCIDAGIIHEEMNGWWLDQRLLIVKFLREDKFHQRFPAC